MNIPAHLLDDPKPVLNYRKSVYTWITVGSAGVTIIPYIFFVISYSKRVLNRNLFLEHLGENTVTTLNGTQDMLTYVFMLFMGLGVVGILVGIIGTVVLLINYNGEQGFRTIRGGCGTALCCQGILIISACAVWVAKALALFNGDAVVDDVRIVATPERVYDMTILVFLNSGMVWGVWALIVPVFATIYFAEKDLQRRIVRHV